jgi:hypothetical protein
MLLEGYEKSDAIKEWSFREADVDEVEESMRCESRWGVYTIQCCVIFVLYSSEELAKI